MIAVTAVYYHGKCEGLLYIVPVSLLWLDTSSRNSGSSMSVDSTSVKQCNGMLRSGMLVVACAAQRAVAALDMQLLQQSCSSQQQHYTGTADSVTLECVAVHRHCRAVQVPMDSYTT
eukprot:3353-Heterococcus_DN1.PRE.10